MKTPGSKKFRIVSLGCRTNQYESQAFHDQLTGMGWSVAAGDEEAELCIVNTCTVTESADSSSRHEIRQLARENPGAKLLVTGCFAERQPDAVLKIGGVTAVVSNKDKEKLLEQVFEPEELPEFSIKQFDAHTRAFVKVQDGCNSFCTYCIIPYVRGRSRSKSVESVLQEVRRLIDNGFKEVVITGINVGDFDGNPGEGEEKTSLASLIRAVDAVPGLKRLRLSSIDPDEVDEDLADAILHGKNTCHSMHIVLQSGSNLVLKRMNRKYTRQIFLDTVDSLRRASPDFTFTTDIIVGFPGETEADFEETLEVMRTVQFAKVHMFPYSPRPRTRAALYPDQIAPEIMRERKTRVLRLAEELSYDLRARYVGKTVSVLTESIDSNHPDAISGHTDNFLNVYIPHRAGTEPNQLVQVKLIENTPAALIGTII